MKDKIVIKGARAHNLKNVDLTIPRDQLVVFTGVSGSGKSSLAFDTIYAEGQRRYVESLSSYARQFLGQMEKPDVDLIEGLSPAISIDQKTTSHNPRSTVGTVTEMRQGNQKTNHRPDCRPHYGAARTDKIAVVGTRGAWQKGRACQAAGGCKKERLCACARGWNFV